MLGGFIIIKSKYSFVVCIIISTMAVLLAGCHVDEKEHDNSFTNLNEERQNGEDQEEDQIEEKQREFTADELLVLLCSKLDINKDDYEYQGKDNYDRYIFTYKMKEGESGNPSSYVIYPLTGNIYDEISEQGIANIFVNKKYVKDEEIKGYIIKNYISDELKTTIYGYEAGNVIIAVYRSTKEKEFDIVKNLQVNPFTGEVHDYETKDFLGELKEKQNIKISD